MNFDPYIARAHPEISFEMHLLRSANAHSQTAEQAGRYQNTE